MILNIISHQALSGKTTVAVNIATGLDLEGFKVLLITKQDDELDVWFNQLTNNNYKFNYLQLKNDSKLLDISDNYDYIIMETNQTELTALDSNRKIYNLFCIDFTSVNQNNLNDFVPLLSDNTYIVPCKVRFKDWQAVELIDYLANQIGYECVLDAIPN